MSTRVDIPPRRKKGGKNMDLLRKLNCTQDAISSLLERVEDGEFTTEQVADTIEALNWDLKRNCDDIAEVIASQENEMFMLKSEIERLKDRFDTIKSSNNKLKLALQTYLCNNDVRKVHTDLHDYSICQNGGKLPVEVTADVYDIPQEYCIYTPKPDIYVIRKALENGQELEFARLKERGEHLRIK